MAELIQHGVSRVSIEQREGSDYSVTAIKLFDKDGKLLTEVTAFNNKANKILVELLDKVNSVTN